MDLDRRELAACIDHTLLKPQASPAQIDDASRIAREYGCASICIAPLYVPRAASIVAGSSTRVCTVIGFPTGAHVPEIKAAEARRALADGARELDMVIPIGALCAGSDAVVSRHLEAVICEANQVPDSLVKVILETASLTRDAIVRGCLLAVEAGADFVKTSTGFGPGGASVEVVALMRKTVGTRCRVKASGGIRTPEAARNMLRAGADRLGTSSSIEILDNWEQSP